MILYFCFDSGSGIQAFIWKEISVMDLATNQKCVLLIDDDPIVRKAHRYPLSAAGWIVQEAENCQQAIEYFTRYRDLLSVIFVDYHLPDMSGAELTKALRKLESSTKQIPIIGVTSHADENTRRICLNAGMTDFYSKPLLQPQLLKLMNQF